MKPLFNLRLHSILICLTGMILLSACVNEEYDLSKDINTEMTILENLSMPFGSIDKIALADILTMEAESESLIVKDDNGDFVFVFSGDRISTDIEIPSFSLASSGKIQTEPIDIRFRTGYAAGLDPSLVSGNIAYSEVTGSILEAQMDIDIDSELPEQIVDVKSVYMNSSVYVNFTVSTGSVHLVQGFTLEFPEFLSIRETGFTDTRFEIVDNHKLVVKEDIRISTASPLTFALMIDKVNVPSGSISGGRLVLDDVVNVKGDFYLSPSDFTVIPEDLLVSIVADITDLEVLSVEAKLAVDETVKGTSVSIGELPGFLSDGNVCLDIYNPVLKLAVSNGSPFAFDVNAQISATKDTESVTLELGGSPAITVPAQTDVNYHISRRETANLEGVTNIVIPELGYMISMLPENISIENIKLSSSIGDFMTITTGDKYQASLSYEVYAPLAFDKDLNIEYTQDIKDFNFRLENIMLESIRLALKIENTVPLDFMFTDVKAIDFDGNVIDGMTVTVSDPIKAGSLASPQVTEVTLSLENGGESVELDGLRLGIKAAAPQTDMYGIALNENQGLRISDIVLTVPEGITFVNDEN